MNGFTTSSIALGILLLASPLALAHEGHAQNAARESRSQASSQSSGISQQQAMREIQIDGYTDVQNLHKTSKGWMAKAKEGNHQVSLLVDDHLNVEKTQAGS
jgi:hypothetical protein